MVTVGVRLFASVVLWVRIYDCESVSLWVWLVGTVGLSGFGFVARSICGSLSLWNDVRQKFLHDVQRVLPWRPKRVFHDVLKTVFHDMQGKHSLTSKTQDWRDVQRKLDVFEHLHLTCWKKTWPHRRGPRPCQSVWAPPQVLNHGNFASNKNRKAGLLSVQRTLTALCSCKVHSS